MFSMAWVSNDVIMYVWRTLWSVIVTVELFLTMSFCHYSIRKTSIHFKTRPYTQSSLRLLIYRSSFSISSSIYYLMPCIHQVYTVNYAILYHICAMHLFFCVCLFKCCHYMSKNRAAFQAEVKDWLFWQNFRYYRVR